MRTKFLFLKWSPPYKMIAIIISAIAISFFKNIYFSAIALLIALLFLLFSDLKIMVILKRIKTPLLFLLPLFLFLPLSSGGDILISFWKVSIYKQGISLSMLIFFKTLSIVLIFSMLTSSTKTVNLFSSLTKLKFPIKFVEMIAFSYRYFFVFRKMVAQMKSSMILKGYKSKNSISSLKDTASLIGMVIIRSFEQTDRVYNAMLLRGYNGEISYSIKYKSNKLDFFKTFLFTIFFLILLFFDIFWRIS